jgi:hypothetical protein
MDREPIGNGSVPATSVPKSANSLRIGVDLAIPQKPGRGHHASVVRTISLRNGIGWEQWRSARPFGGLISRRSTAVVPSTTIRPWLITAVRSASAPLLHIAPREKTPSLIVTAQPADEFSDLLAGSGGRARSSARRATDARGQALQGTCDF